MVLGPVPAQTINDTDPNIVFCVDLLRLNAIFKASMYWVTEERQRASRVSRFRKYYDGDHDAKLTPEMKTLLRIQDPNDGFTLNLMPVVVDTKADRCIVQSIDAIVDEPKGQPEPAEDESEDILEDPTRNPSAWIQDRMMSNRFDILQGEVHQASIRDGDSYIMVSWNNDEQRVEWTYEEGFDGYTGMIAYYPSRNVPKMEAALKFWQIQVPAALTGFQYMTRCNIYYPDRIEKYQANGGASFEPYLEEGETTHIHKWVDRAGQPIGIPVIHFKNGGRHNYGISELRNAISPQNALNRFNYSAVMISELTAFSILVARGHVPPTDITPAMIYRISDSPLENNQVADLNRLPAGDLTPILNIIDKQRQLIADITRTPSNDLTGGSAHSGEYLKQLEIGLLGKVRTFQTHAGAAWEMVGDMSWKVQAAFGIQKPPAYKRFRTVWRSAELRDDTAIVRNAVLMDPIWGHEQTLRATADVFDLDEHEIADLMENLKAQPATGNPEAPQVSVNPSKGTASVKEPAIAITPGGDQVQASTQNAPTQNAPAIGKATSNRTVQPISDAELSAITKLHSAMVGGGG